MDKIINKGKADLFGSINIPGSKNSALPILVSSLLSKEEIKLNNIPELLDINSMINLLKNFGVNIKKTGSTISLNSYVLKNNIIYLFDFQLT